MLAESEFIDVASVAARTRNAVASGRPRGRFAWAPRAAAGPVTSSDPRQTSDRRGAGDIDSDHAPASGGRPRGTRHDFADPVSAVARPEAVDFDGPGRA